MKIHAKTTLVVRRERDALRRYVHIGTGNYHATTARMYEDVGLFTADPDVAADVAGPGLRARSPLPRRPRRRRRRRRPLQLRDGLRPPPQVPEAARRAVHAA